MFDWALELISDSGWAYGAVLAIAALDAVFPIVPSETAAIAAGVAAAAGDLSLALVIGAAAAGAFVGDSGAYLVGRTLGEPTSRRFFASCKGRRRREWAQRMLDERGGYLIVVARFVPGGRTAATVTAGVLRMRWVRFLAYAAVAAVLWASYAALLGYGGGRTFEQNPSQGLLLALGVALAIVAGVEVYRRYGRRLADSP